MWGGHYFYHMAATSELNYEMPFTGNYLRAILFKEHFAIFNHFQSTRMRKETEGSFPL